MAAVYELEFHPSEHSFASEAEYHGWLQNIWSKKGRAKNKLKRAKRKRKRGNKKAADRLEYRAGVLKAKAKGRRPSLHPKSTYKKLWSVKFPWYRRQRMGGSGLTGAARGYRPSRPQIRSEWRGTVLGGLTALQLAGIEGYEDINVKSLPQKMKQSTTQDKKLVRVAAKATGKNFHGSLKKASGEIRRIVQRHELEGVAWPARALPMLGASMKRSAITSAATGAASAGLHIAAGTSAAASASVVTAIVTLPVAAILEGAALVTGAISAGAAVKQSIAKGAAGKFQQKLQANLEEWGFDKESEAIKAQVAQEKAKLAYQESVAVKVGEMKGQDIVSAVTVLAWAGGISFALVATSAVIGHVRNRE